LLENLSAEEAHFRETYEDEKAFEDFDRAKITVIFSKHTNKIETKRSLCGPSL